MRACFARRGSWTSCPWSPTPRFTSTFKTPVCAAPSRPALFGSPPSSVAHEVRYLRRLRSPGDFADRARLSHSLAVIGQLPRRPRPARRDGAALSVQASGRRADAAASRDTRRGFWYFARSQRRAIRHPCRRSACPRVLLQRCPLRAFWKRSLRTKTLPVQPRLLTLSMVPFHSVNPTINAFVDFNCRETWSSPPLHCSVHFNAHPQIGVPQWDLPHKPSAITSRRRALP